MSDETGEMETWSDPDGGTDVAGTGHTFVTEPEWFDDLDEPVPVRRRRWVCVADETGTYWPAAPMLCEMCGGEGEVFALDPERHVECATCAGTGEHPMRGAGFVSGEALPSGP